MSTLRSQEFTASGNFTVPANVTSVLLSMIPGGGSGKGHSIGGGVPSAGGGGATGEWIFNMPVKVTPGDVMTVVVGTGGVAAATGLRGTGGTDSSFGPFVVTGFNFTALIDNAGNSAQGGRGGGQLGAITGGLGILGGIEAVAYIGGASGGGGGAAGAIDGSNGATAPGQFGGVGGTATGTDAGGGGGASTPWGQGGKGGDGGGGAAGVGSTPPSDHYGAGGGAAGALFAGGILKAGDGVDGYVHLTWFE